MHPIHLEPDSLHLAARALLQDYYHLADRVFVLRVQFYRLEMSWQGGDAEEYLYELHILLNRLEARLDELVTLGITLARQAEAWEESDQRWAGVYRERMILPPGE